MLFVEKAFCEDLNLNVAILCALKLKKNLKCWFVFLVFDIISQNYMYLLRYLKVFKTSSRNAIPVKTFNSKRFIGALTELS